jgi:hypothetical protein
LDGYRERVYILTIYECKVKRKENKLKEKYLKEKDV